MMCFVSVGGIYLKISRRAFIEAFAVVVLFFIFFPFYVLRVFSKGKDNVLRPPGAIEETDFNTRCIRCSRCAQVCRTSAIHLAGWFDNVSLDTPIVDPDKCMLCLECVSVCPTGALTEVGFNPDTYPAKMERDHYSIDTSLCYRYSGRKRKCSACYDSCPRKGKAIVWDSAKKRPVMDDKYCTGCGICEKVCPAVAITGRQEIS